MKFAGICVALCCAVVCMAATRGTIVTQEQIDLFQRGVATIADVERELGEPQGTHPLDNGDTAVDYILTVQESIEAEQSPVARLQADRHDIRVEFAFDKTSHLVGVTTSRRDMVCAHKVCPSDTTPWLPAAPPNSRSN
jgi:hypothetical protein